MSESVATSSSLHSGCAASAPKLRTKPWLSAGCKHAAVLTRAATADRYANASTFVGTAADKNQVSSKHRAASSAWGSKSCY